MGGTSEAVVTDGELAGQLIEHGLLLLGDLVGVGHDVRHTQNEAAVLLDLIGRRLLLDRSDGLADALGKLFAGVVGRTQRGRVKPGGEATSCSISSLSPSRRASA